MTDVERLARDICWAGFNFPPKGGKIKYWARIAPKARESYIKTAEEFMWIVSRIDQRAFEMVEELRKARAA